MFFLYYNLFLLKKKNNKQKEVFYSLNLEQLCQEFEKYKEIKWKAEWCCSTFENSIPVIFIMLC